MGLEEGLVPGDKLGVAGACGDDTYFCGSGVADGSLW